MTPTTLPVARVHPGLPIFRLDNGALKVIYGAVILVTVSLAAPAMQSLLSRRRRPDS